MYSSMASEHPAPPASAHERQSPTFRYSYVESDKIPHRLQCAVCLEPFIDPRRTPCKHHFCATCISSQSSCPTCRAPVPSALLEADSKLQEFLADLQVYCTCKDSGCGWTGPRGNLDEHLAWTCAHQLCTNVSRGCNFVGKAPVIQAHQSECAYSDVGCLAANLYCLWRGAR